ncbi:MAG: hypothetical protein M3Q23_04950, partial [Actinomycetota bacterium]|nr:hypothetical protein [Actinomycetota bacterium]
MADRDHDAPPGPVLGEPRRYLLLANPASGTKEDRELVRRARQGLGDVQEERIAPGVDLAAAIRAGVSEGRIV